MRDGISTPISQHDRVVRNRPYLKPGKENQAEYAFDYNKPTSIHKVKFNPGG
ncbi:hypothetical protein ADIS_2089 [Lunatimonas lonarensis]|uniref:Uncharacterized protein n=1 Tax=Lunatimonas lonarensis TaxID=1232681 RepID=R7ZTS1_9BACT|nr:hypothetical protein ADIS_2089 [Lunatimonas lonarensis]